MLEGHTREVLCLDVQKEAAFSGRVGDDLDDGDHDFDENDDTPEMSSVWIKRRPFSRS